MPSSASSGRQRALVLCLSPLKRDPRVIRQVEWLTEAGWDVDTMGLGPLPSESAREHFELLDEPAWTRPRPVRAALLLSPHALRYRTLLQSRIPAGVHKRVREGQYDLIVFNDIDYLPWATRLKSAGLAKNVHLHLDLHEYYTKRLPQGTTLPLLMNSYNRWLRRFIASSTFTTRTTVADGIADIYHEEFGIERPSIVRNAPAFVDQAPSPVDPERIELIYHGHAAWARGLRELIDAIPLLDRRFVLRLMLTGDPAVKAQLAGLTAHLGERVEFSPPVAMHEVASSINRSDLEVMLFPPNTPNLRFALPNKLFEAVQGRLGLIVGASPSMTNLIAKYGNGAVVDGWTAADLATTINALTADDVTRFKLASDTCAGELNSAEEGQIFVAIVAARSPSNELGQVDIPTDGEGLR